MQKCLNDMFGGFCNGKPDVDESKNVTIGTETLGFTVLKTCRLSPKSCKHYETFSRIVKPAQNLGAARTRKAEEEDVLIIPTKPKAKCRSKKKKEGVGFKQEALL